jgi:hypothetical protein
MNCYHVSVSWIVRVPLARRSAQCYISNDSLIEAYRVAVHESIDVERVIELTCELRAVLEQPITMQ